MFECRQNLQAKICKREWQPPVKGGCLYGEAEIEIKRCSGKDNPHLCLLNLSQSRKAHAVQRKFGTADPGIENSILYIGIGNRN